MICVFDGKGIAHRDFALPGQIVNQVCTDQKRIIRVCVTRHCRQMQMFHHDNSPCHTTLFVTECLTSKGIPVVPQLPDLSPCDFFLNWKIATQDTISGLLDIQKSVTVMRKTTSVGDSELCYQKWEQRLQTCLASQAHFFERSNIDVVKNNILKNKQFITFLPHLLYRC